MLRYVSAGESHGPALTIILDGVPAGLPLTTVDHVDPWLRRRQGGYGRGQRMVIEQDRAVLKGGVRAGRTTGAPVAMEIVNRDWANWHDVMAVEPGGEPRKRAVTQPRPGHADLAGGVKYGHKDLRDVLERASARETAARVAAGAVARRVLGESVRIRAAVVQIGKIAIDRTRWDWSETENNPFWCPDAETAKQWETLLDETRKDGNSVGAVIEVEAAGVPAGWGAPIYGKLDAEIAGAMMSINAVKGVEIGAGFAAAELTGVENADEMRAGNDGEPVFLSNAAGGVLGGVSTGQPVVARIAIKPTSSILTPRRTITRDRQNAEVSTKGRHDPCVGIRGAPVAEAMLACVLADAKLRHRGQTGR